MTHPDFTKAVSHITADSVRNVLLDLVDIPSTTGKEITTTFFFDICRTCTDTRIDATGFRDGS